MTILLTRIIALLINELTYMWLASRRRPLGFVCHAFISPPRERNECVEANMWQVKVIDLC